MIYLEDITKIFRARKKEVLALNSINLSVPEGKFVLIKGHSGCGKSTLLFTIGGMLEPSSGEVKVMGEKPYLLAEKERTRFLSSLVGFVFQSYHLVPYLNVLENILLAAKAGNSLVSKKEAIRIATELGIEHRLHHKPEELSEGEKQRVALARSFIIQPKIILADEPTGNLDPQNTSEVLRHLAQFNSEGGTVLMVSHGDEADKYADTIVLMEKGKITEIITNNT